MEATATCSGCRAKNRIPPVGMIAKCGRCGRFFEPFQINVARAMAAPPPPTDEGIDELIDDLLDDEDDDDLDIEDEDEQ